YALLTRPSYFLYLLPTPPRPTLFPYTTLFRSAADVLALKPDGVFLSNGPGDPEPLDYAIQNVRALLAKKPIFGICLGHQIDSEKDRKSTRLNSSHRTISYAVFCLKKKKKNKVK